MSSAARNPVLLIHGIDDSADVFYAMSAYLKRQGWEVHSLDLVPNNGDVGLDHMARWVASYADRVFPAGQPFDLVGFSMGGIISRYYVQRLGGLERVQRFITISSPHQGTCTAYFRWNIGASQMRLGSSFLEDLNREVNTLERINFTSIWTPLDLMIVPAVSSRLPVGREVLLQVPAHPWMLTAPQCWEAVAEALREPLRQRAIATPPYPQSEQTRLPQKSLQRADKT